MKYLSEAARKKAETFLTTQARPLEQALFAAFVQGAPADWALDELAAFQNSDGGFGHGLEPDLQIPVSSILATTIALQHLRALKVSDDHPLVQGAMRYLLDTYDVAAMAWPFVPPQVDDAPHAPWWQPNIDLSMYLANPRAEIVGYLYDYSELVPAEMRENLLTAAITYIEELDQELEMHELLCYGRLVETDSLPNEAFDRLLSRLRPMISAAVERDPSKWDGYVLMPLNVAPTPTSIFAELLRDSIEANLDFEIDRQQKDGSWSPNWSWGDAYPEAWPHAKRAWQGVLTVNTTKTLYAYGRVKR